MNLETQSEIQKACSSSREGVIKAYSLRFFLPWLFLAPLVFFGLMTGPVLATFFVFVLIRRLIEDKNHNHFAAIYTMRHFNMRTKGN